MATPNREKRRILFDKFSRNLGWVKNHPKIKFEPDVDEAVVCPLCFNLFAKIELDTSLENHLTLEDVPPKSLGGKGIALTCKTCNSISGHQLDGELLKVLLQNDIKNFLPNSRSSAVFRSDENEVNGEVSVDEKGKVKLNIQRARSNPIKSDGFMKDLNPNGRRVFPIPSSQLDTPSFKVEFPKNSNQRRAEMALLRAAYLKAFALFGNGFLINPNLYSIRDWLQNPDKEMIPEVFWIRNNYSEKMEGLHIITEPPELRSFLVVFKLKTKSSEIRVGIVLPGPSRPGLKVYDFLNSWRENEVPVKTEHIPSDGCVEDESQTFLLNAVWQELCQ